MANSYSAPNFNIDTATNVAGLTALKGSAPALTDNIYIYNGVTLTVESALSCLKIYLGQTSAGAAGAGNRYGILTVNAGVTVTFAGNATNTNSGIQSNPTTADASSLNCALNILGTSASHVVFTNDGNANDTNKKYCISMVYGSLNIDYLDVNYAYSNVFPSFPGNTTRAAVGSVAKHVTLSTSAANQDLFNCGLATVDLAHDLRFSTMDISFNGNFRVAVFNSADFASGGSVDISGWATKGTPSPADFVPCVFEGSVQYGGAYKASYLDIRPTIIVPTGLAFTNPGTGGELRFTISNAASYASTDEIVIYNSVGDTLMGCIPISRYNSLGYGLISGLTDGQAYTLYSKATSDNATYSAASANAAAATPTLAATDPSFVALEDSRNDDPGVANVVAPTAYKIQGSSKVGEYAAGIAIPATITGLSATGISATTLTLHWDMGALTGGPVAYYQVSTDGVNAAYTGIVDLEKYITGLTASTAYTLYVRGVNDAGAGSWSAVYNVNTTTTTPILTTIEAAAKTLIEGMTTAGGYFYNWGDSNEPDHAKKDAYPNAEISITDESNQDEADAAHSLAYANRATLEISVYSKLTTLDDNPDFKINENHNKALDDLKRLFGTEENVSGTCNLILYSGSTREQINTGSVIVTGRLITRWTVFYSQSRTTPTDHAN